MDRRRDEPHGGLIAAVFAIDAIIGLISLFQVASVGLASISSSDGSLAGRQSSEASLLVWGGIAIALLAATAFWSYRKGVVALVYIQCFLLLFALYFTGSGDFA